MGTSHSSRSNPVLHVAPESITTSIVSSESITTSIVSSEIEIPTTINQSVGIAVIESTPETKNGMAVDAYGYASGVIRDRKTLACFSNPKRYYQSKTCLELDEAESRQWGLPSKRLGDLSYLRHLRTRLGISHHMRTPFEYSLHSFSPLEIELSRCDDDDDFVCCVKDVKAHANGAYCAGTALLQTPLMPTAPKVTSHLLGPPPSSTGIFIEGPRLPFQDDAALISTFGACGQVHSAHLLQRASDPSPTSALLIFDDAAALQSAIQLALSPEIGATAVRMLGDAVERELPERTVDLYSSGTATPHLKPSALLNGALFSIIDGIPSCDHGITLCSFLTAFEWLHRAAKGMSCYGPQMEETAAAAYAWRTLFALARIPHPNSGLQNVYEVVRSRCQLPLKIHCQVRIEQNTAAVEQGDVLEIDPEVPLSYLIAMYYLEACTWFKWHGNFCTSLGIACLLPDNRTLSGLYAMDDD